MRSFLRVHMPFARAGVYEMLAYRVSFFFGVSGDILRCFILYFLWSAVFNSSGQVLYQGFTKLDMVLYIFVSFFTGCLADSSCA
jgi:ABC-2 type transport system permease protein